MAWSLPSAHYVDVFMKTFCMRDRHHACYEVPSRLTPVGFTIYELGRWAVADVAGSGPELAALFVEAAVGSAGRPGVVGVALTRP